VPQEPIGLDTENNRTIGIPLRKAQIDDRPDRMGLATPCCLEGRKVIFALQMNHGRSHGIKIQRETNMPGVSSEKGAANGLIQDSILIDFGHGIISGMKSLINQGAILNDNV
jgi:hypothetical protein